MKRGVFMGTGRFEPALSGGNHGVSFVVLLFYSRPNPSNIAGGAGAPGGCFLIPKHRFSATIPQIPSITGQGIGIIAHYYRDGNRMTLAKAGTMKRQRHIGDIIPIYLLTIGIISPILSL